MGLSKFSAKEMGKKLIVRKQADATKKAEEQKRLKLEAIELKKQAEKERREEAERQEVEMHLEMIRTSLLNDLMSECLDVALGRGYKFEIDRDNFEDFHYDQEEYTNFLEAKGFNVSEEIVKSTPIRHLEKKINALSPEEFTQLRKEVEKILLKLQKFKITEANLNIESILNQKNSFQFAFDAFYFLSENLSENFEHDDLLDDDLSEDYPKFSNRLNFCRFVDSRESFIVEYFPYMPIDEDEEAYFLNWKEPKEDQINDSWFNAKNLKWISGKAGKSFFDELLAQINSKTEALSASLLFDAFEKSENTYLLFEGGEKIKTPIPLLQLLEIFEIFGYKKRIPKADKSGYLKSIKISWKN